jgi:hypothetical protein
MFCEEALSSFTKSKVVKKTKWEVGGQFMFCERALWFNLRVSLDLGTRIKLGPMTMCVVKPVFSNVLEDKDVRIKSENNFKII